MSSPRRLASLGLAVAVAVNIAEIVAVALGGVSVFRMVALAFTMFGLGFCVAVWILLPVREEMPDRPELDRPTVEETCLTDRSFYPGDYGE